MAVRPCPYILVRTAMARRPRKKTGKKRRNTKGEGRKKKRRKKREKRKEKKERIKGKEIKKKGRRIKNFEFLHPHGVFLKKKTYFKPLMMKKKQMNLKIFQEENP